MKDLIKSILLKPYILQVVFFNSRQKKETFRIDVDSCSIEVYEDLLSNHKTLNATILFINISTDCEMCFIFEEHFVRKIGVHRLLLKQSFHVHIYDVMICDWANISAIT